MTREEIRAKATLLLATEDLVNMTRKETRRILTEAVRQIGPLNNTGKKREATS